VPVQRTTTYEDLNFANWGQTQNREVDGNFAILGLTRIREVDVNSSHGWLGSLFSFVGAAGAGDGSGCGGAAL
jgi:hypothetical protein